MARRRDTVTRQIAGFRRATGNAYSPAVKNPYAGAEGRFSGRRGVRARARANRIAARKAIGTYRQPGGGTTTNS